MSWQKSLSSTIGRKIMMSLSGILLILFLAGHVSGNMTLLLGKADAFNAYAHFMSTNPAVQVIANVFKLFFVGHIFYAAVLTLQNKKARGGEAYKVTNKDGSSVSKYMGVLGSVIAVFLVIHLSQYWAVMHEYAGTIGMTSVDGVQMKDLYAVVNTSYQNPVIVAGYVISMIILAYHLWHGFASAFQTLGINNKRYTPIISFVGKAYSIIVPLLFAAIPVAMFIRG
ncbi:succinate dehydrogenase cytochrome b subunit [Flammeovirga yaeyamensis]|uniref:Succinate dehydrogenase cytochrome b subunit n=1 Tax=Flammeovirga yaeyamensis TaxID=367791 RepID=A0AAX1N507_9BACT|nr:MULTISPECIES: succinate dehydrogenase cytochrome b subunit [Flammeovirga]ANQ47647.2 succinate dehydrogenase cytochrome b subunit [Flammeovirga sp. MY04]MBB3700103.1 succinate dehydrogenase / fumarate reductase cytochrome b subunit [Flammeovirga yaeyamensis]NMF37266.1 succinate dehydrogenase cytochrome b subunit [Flammeovirga yaeyamensis]QWG00953.1 succinate dehydrogenase cytochrome b subunit [Flammeovirga yaeyamensis]